MQAGLLLALTFSSGASGAVEAMLQEGLRQWLGLGRGAEAQDVQFLTAALAADVLKCFLPQAPRAVCIQPGITGTAPIPYFCHCSVSFPAHFCTDGTCSLLTWVLGYFFLKGRTHPGDGETDQRHQEPCELLTMSLGRTLQREAG